MNDRIGKYTIVRRLAVGGTAEAYLATQAELAGVTREVVIKCILPHLVKDNDFIDTFLAEAKNVAKLTHPNILSVQEFGWEGDRCYLVFEHVPGVELDAAIERTRGIKPSYALKIASEICAGLDYAHTLEDDSGEFIGIIHSDVNPHNVLLGLDGSVKVFDFGIAKAVAQSQKMHPGSYEGRYHYIAPEQALGADIDHRADVHAVGVLLWEMVTGRALFKRSSLFKTIEAVINEPPPSALDADPELTPEIDAIIARATAKDPSERYQSCGEVQLAIDEYIANAGLHSTVLALGRYVERFCLSDFDLHGVENEHAFLEEGTTVDENGRRILESVNGEFKDDDDDATSVETIRRRDVAPAGDDDEDADVGATINLRIGARDVESLRAPPSPAPVSDLAAGEVLPAVTTETPPPTPIDGTPPSDEENCSDASVNDTQEDALVTRRHPSRPPESPAPQDMVVPPTAVVVVPNAEREVLPRTSVATPDDMKLPMVAPRVVIPDRIGLVHAEKTLPYHTSSPDVTVEGRYAIRARRRRYVKLIVLAIVILVAAAVVVFSLLSPAPGRIVGDVVEAVSSPGD